jgi:hypothetical protein
MTDLKADSEMMEAIVAESRLFSSVARKIKKKRRKGIMPSALIVVDNTNDSGIGSLRQAIITANGNGMPDTILFNIPAGDPGFDVGTGTFVIAPGPAALPQLTEGGTAIDGTSQTVFGGDTNPGGPEVVLDIGNVVGGGTPGLVINNSADNSIMGLVINGFPGPSIGTAIRITGPLATGNTVKGCYIGTDPTGSVGSPAGNFANGIVIIGGSNSNTIGGTSPADRNVVSGNRFGISITGFPVLPNPVAAGNNVIQGNYIGVDASGTFAVPNFGEGIAITGSDGNLIGGTDPGAGNVSSGNGTNGVRISGIFLTSSPGGPVTTVLPSMGNIIHGNKFGTNAAGTAAIENGVDGVRLNNGALNNIVGGPTAAERNLCSGNFAHGVHLDALRTTAIPLAGVSGNLVRGNYIGTDVSGLNPVPNTLPGVVAFFGASNNVIGGTAPGEGNLIAFNTGQFLPGPGGPIFVAGAGVSVGQDPAFVPTPPPDPDLPPLANDPVVGIRITGNSIHSNDGLGIDLNLMAEAPDAQDGPTANDAGDGDIGGNNFQNFPVLSSVANISGNTVVSGSLSSTPNSSFVVEFFSNAACDPSGFGEGQTYLGSTTVATDGSGNGNFTATLPALSGCQTVTATATDADGNTSEFSPCEDEAPGLSCGVGSTQLWPPNHNLINVGLTGTATDNCPNPAVSVQVFSDEDDEEQTGDGNHSPDAKDIGVGTLRLRSERNGGGDGRVYLIIVTATDSGGNVTRCCSTVTVPHSQSKASKASVAAQAAAAAAFCAANGTAPPGYFVVGDGAIIGPKQ